MVLGGTRYLGYIWVFFENGIFRGPALIGDHGLMANNFSFNCLELLWPGWNLETKTYEN